MTAPRTLREVQPSPAGRIDAPLARARPPDKWKPPPEGAGGGIDRQNKKNYRQKRFTAILSEKQAPLTPVAEARTACVHLGLVEGLTRPPRPRRLSVQFHVFDRPAPYGRSRLFHIRPDDLEELLHTVARMETRR